MSVLAVTDDTLPLFPDAPYAAGGVTPDDPPAPTPVPAVASEPEATEVPLAERMRPQSLDAMLGQQALIGKKGTLRRLLERNRLPSMILHGPPGSGKTTLARLLAREVSATFVPFSAVSEGVPRLREIVRQAEQHRKTGRRTLLFVDEIHRLNKGQQDFLLPFVESGLVTLVGATTEHPGFEVNPALLSRARVLVLSPLDPEDLRTLLLRALEDAEHGLGGWNLTLNADAERLLVEGASGDARQALNALEVAASFAGPGGRITEALAVEALQRRIAGYDTSTGYQLLSAFHKSLRASEADAALYWAMRMIRGGEEPRVIFRRLIAAAYEDVGLADPQAGVIATQALQAFERLGAPEGYLPLANAVVYVASAPKSNRAYAALRAAMNAAEQVPDAPVPLPLRKASTALMREWGFGKGYKYAHDYENGYTELQCLPEELREGVFYEPTEHGYEREISKRMRERGQRS